MGSKSHIDSGSPATDSNGAVMLSQQSKNNGQGESKPGEESFIQED
jgi:hypothetical protein